MSHIDKSTQYISGAHGPPSNEELKQLSKGDQPFCIGSWSFPDGSIKFVTLPVSASSKGDWHTAISVFSSSRTVHFHPSKEKNEISELIKQPL